MPASNPSACHATAWQRWSRQRGAAARALWPLSLLYGGLTALRKALYRLGIFKSSHPGVPVIVVGNVIAGGAGKTPVVMAMVQHLQAQGWRPGVLSRGYGRSTRDNRIALPGSSGNPPSLPSEVGDEPALIARSCQVPVAVARQRSEAAQLLLATSPDTNILVCDDGLQHWALQRDIEICVFNEHGIGNGWLLPAGPLREAWPRRVDMVVYAGQPPQGKVGQAVPQFAVQRQLADFAVRADGSRVALASLQGMPLLALAAIARPSDFFAQLQAQGLLLAETLALPDHFDFDSWKRPYLKGYSLICTEKDAVKLWPQHPDVLAVPLQLQLGAGFFATLDALLQPHTLRPSPSSTPHET
ncbi:MAG: tetraacyldisaccharide 4'-kinase [Giesbergeria sp.]|nr:tetraacyldisaccharide 4'-kinase [Giesbergeria sp.]